VVIELNRWTSWLFIWLLCGTVTAGLMLFFPVADLIGLIILILEALLILLLAVKQSTIGKTLIVAFLLRAIAALVHYYIIPLPDSQADARSFERLAAEWAEYGFVNLLHQFRTGSELYPWLIAVIYSIVGRSPLTAQAINVLFGSLIVRNTYLLAKQFWDNRVATRAAWIATLFPTLILYSAITLREVAVVFPLTLGVLYFLWWLHKERPIDLVKAFIACGIATAFHTGIVVVILIMALTTFSRWLRALCAVHPKLTLTRSFALCLLVLSIYIIFISGWGLEKLGGFKVSTAVDWLANLQRNYAIGRAAYLQHLQPRSVFDLIWQTPIRITYFLFMPFPWFVRTWVDLLGVTISACNLLLTILILRSFPKIWATYERRWGLYTLLALLGTFALATSNYGTSIRHSSKLVPLALALAKIPKVRI